MRAILHIGLEKTGTTSIQQLLKLGVPQLRKAGVWVCESQHSGNNFHLALASFEAFRPDSLLRTLGITSAKEFEVFSARQARLLQREVQQAKAAGCNTFLISSEHLQSRLTKDADLAKLKSMLSTAGIDEIEILCYLRSPLRIALSHHGMAIKKGVHISDEALLPGNPRVSHILDFENMVRMWSNAFGRSNLTLRLYPEGGASDLLLREFIAGAAPEVDFDELPLPGRTNANLSEEALLILNALNAQSKLVANQWQNRKFFNMLESAVPGRGLSASDALVDIYNSAFAEPLANIKSEFFANHDGPLLHEAHRSAAPPTTEQLTTAASKMLEVALSLTEAQAAKPLERRSGFLASAKRAVKRVLKRFL
ncbi:MAG: hypothetical protein RL102_550 [Actinomycetota bacterium]|jgi:hypothetical protein